MKAFAKSLLLVTLLTIGFRPLLAQADTTQIEGVTITEADVSPLLTALHTALKPNDATIPIAVSLKAPTDMPAYDPKWHYAGVQLAAAK